MRSQIPRAASAVAILTAGEPLPYHWTLGAKEDFASVIGAPSRPGMVNRKPIEIFNQDSKCSALFQP